MALIVQQMAVDWPFTSDSFLSSMCCYICASQRCTGWKRSFVQGMFCIARLVSFFFVRQWQEMRRSVQSRARACSSLKLHNSWMERSHIKRYASAGCIFWSSAPWGMLSSPCGLSAQPSQGCCALAVLGCPSCAPSPCSSIPWREGIMAPCTRVTSHTNHGTRTLSHTKMHRTTSAHVSLCFRKSLE